MDHAEGGLECRGDPLPALHLCCDGEEYPYSFEVLGDTLWLVPERPLSGKGEGAM